MKLHKKIGGQRHREWAWAWVVIMAVTAAVAWFGAQEPAMPGAQTVQGTSQAAGTGGSASAPADNSVAGVLATIPEASAFNAYFKAHKVALGAGPYTVFVPTDAAFGTLAKGTVSGLSAAAQKRLVEYHVVAGKMLDTDAIASGNYQAMSKDLLNFNVNLQTGASYVNSGKIIRQYKASNGVIYTISSVLFPPTAR